MTPTRNPNLAIRRDAARLWRFVDVSTASAVGPLYATKAEALADLARYETAAGWIG